MLSRCALSLVPCTLYLVFAMKKAVLLFLLQPILCHSQDKNDELIQWKDGQKLTWADYKGKVDSAADAAASTATYLGIEYNFSNNSVDYKITCSFSKTKSWGLHKNDHILSHEQGHFDITEIYARKLNKQMKNYQFNKDTYKTDLRKIYMTILEEKENMQNSYDDETNHSINREKQAEWSRKISDLLNEYKTFSNYQ